MQHSQYSHWCPVSAFQNISSLFPQCQHQTISDQRTHLQGNLFRNMPMLVSRCCPVTKNMISYLYVRVWGLPTEQASDWHYFKSWDSITTLTLTWKCCRIKSCPCIFSPAPNVLLLFFLGGGLTLLLFQEKAITPSESFLFPTADWLIGNHSDELTPWIPIIAARQVISWHNLTQQLKCQLISLACGEHNKQEGRVCEGGTVYVF